MRCRGGDACVGISPPDLSVVGVNPKLMSFLNRQVVHPVASILLFGVGAGLIGVGSVDDRVSRVDHDRVLRAGFGGIPAVLAAEIAAETAAETMALPRLTPEAVRSRLETLPNWRMNETGTALIHQRTLNDFGATVSFVRCLVPIADAAQHHPDIAIRYNQLTLTLTTHDVGGLTELDFQLADAINRLRCPLLPVPGRDNDAP